MRSAAYYLYSFLAIHVCVDDLSIDRRVLEEEEKGFGGRAGNRHGC
jgi:hypothetical protein